MNIQFSSRPQQLKQWTGSVFTMVATPMAITIIIIVIIVITSMTTPQDAHKRLVMQVAEWLTASRYQCSREVSDMS